MKNVTYLPRIKALFSIICIVICFAVLSGCSLLSSDTVSNLANSDKVTVPDFSGLNYEDILKDENFSDLNLSFKFENNNAVSAGQVISQGVEAGKTINKNTEVIIVISNGPEAVEIPVIVGLDNQEAKMLLTKKGIKFNEIPIASDEVPQNQVIATNPEPGVYVQYGAVIDIYVSNGPNIQYAKVGDYLKLSESAAKELIEKDGFTVGTVTEEDSDAQAGYVISQSVTAGSMLEKGSVIDLVISTGTALYEHKLILKNELLDLVFDEEYKDMSLSLIIDGTVSEQTPVFDVNVREGEFEFRVTSKSTDVKAVIRINFTGGETLDAFTYKINMTTQTATLTKNNDLYDYVIGVD